MPKMAKGWPPCEGRKTMEEPEGKGKSKKKLNFWQEILSGVESLMNREMEKEKTIVMKKPGMEWIPFGHGG